jgi:hypothetical protein
VVVGGVTGRAPGRTREAQKQPGILPAHTATRAQHSPPLYVLQQQSTSCATLHLLWMINASPPSGSRHPTVLPRWLSQRDSAFADAAKMNAKVTTMILPMAHSRWMAAVAAAGTSMEHLKHRRPCPQRQQVPPVGYQSSQ